MKQWSSALLWAAAWCFEGSVCQEVWNPVTLQTSGAQSRIQSERLRGIPNEVLATVNDWHYAMMNDHPRNEAFEKALVAAIEPHQSTVVDVGAGAGLLSAIAARAGAAHVTSIEASPTLAAITRKIMHANGLSDRVSVINDFSTHVVPSDMEGQRADVLVSEVLGTLLLGEGALHYMSDARLRLLKPKGAVIPAGGTQYVTVVSSPALQALTHVSRYQNIDLSALNTLKDTDNLVFTKQYGLSLRYMRPTMVSGHLPLFTVDFEHDAPGSVQSEAVLRFEAQCTCAVHALVFHWEAWTDRHKQYNISTWTVDDPNPERDAAWGAGIQLVSSGGDNPVPFRVVKGERLLLRVVKLESASAIQGFLERDSDLASEV
ncbi:Protein arginine N-methyltransferase 7 [Diplonema papillatum]|nr:Protein arginine N-methyltransferase 7 [Diplonema papillatum]